MTLRTRLDKLERGRPGAFDALGEVLASVASRGLRIHARPANLPMPICADPDEVSAALEALCHAPSRRTLSLEIRP
jgi:hypothetical protein